MAVSINALADDVNSLADEINGSADEFNNFTVLPTPFIAALVGMAVEENQSKEILLLYSNIL